MPEGDGYQISPQELESHEHDVRELMSNIQGATSGAFEPIDINAFGLIGSTWSWSLHYWTDAADTSIKQAVDTGNHVADQLKGMRETYQEHDNAGASRFSTIHEGMN
jgi:excreted virulence factor EspC (type VII ESX diderm)